MQETCQNPSVVPFHQTLLVLRTLPQIFHIWDVVHLSSSKEQKHLLHFVFTRTNHEWQKIGVTSPFWCDVNGVVCTVTLGTQTCVRFGDLQKLSKTHTCKSLMFESHKSRSQLSRPTSVSPFGAGFLKQLSLTLRKYSGCGIQRWVISRLWLAVDGTEHLPLLAHVLIPMTAPSLIANTTPRTFSSPSVTDTPVLSQWKPIRGHCVLNSLLKHFFFSCLQTLIIREKLVEKMPNLFSPWQRSRSVVRPIQF